MTTRPNGQAPAGDTYAIGAKGGKVGQAWQLIWDRLDRDTWQDGTILAAEAAAEVGVKPVSVISHLHRMAAEGHLDSEVLYGDAEIHKFGQVYQARRKRTHYRLPNVITEDVAA